MTESVNFSANSAPHTIDSAMLKPNNASQARVDRGEKPATHQASPDVAITEVASKAAVGKKESLDSINKVTQELRDAINTLNAALEKTKTKAIITRDEEINRFIVRIADQEERGSR